MDAGTLIQLETLMLYFMGGLMLLAAVQGGGDRALFWMASNCLMAGTAFLLTLLTFGDPTHKLMLIGANMLFVASHGAVWATMRIFSRREVKWRYLAAGPVAWLVLYQIPWISQSDGMRIAAYSFLCLIYLILAMREIWPELKIDWISTLPVIVMLAEHSLFYTYRLVLGVSDLADWRFTRWASRPDFVSLMIEAILFTISLNFGILIIVRARAERNFRHGALHDPLTSLLNRRALFDIGKALLERKRVAGDYCSLLLFDLDWFKSINDRYGHDAGDQVLQLFAQVLRDNVRPEDLCARIGGEEFVILAPGLSADHAVKMANRVRREFMNHPGLDAKGLPSSAGQLSTSVGIACTRTIGHSLETLLENADHALYTAKAAGRNCVRQYDGADSFHFRKTRTHSP
jgi:diguanylate cyclase (GGDEF)-like protein